MNPEEYLEDDIVTAILTDLPLASEQAEDTKAGFGGVTFIGPPAAEDLKKTGLGTLILPNDNRY